MHGQRTSETESVRLNTTTPYGQNALQHLGSRSGHLAGIMAAR